MSRLFNNYAVPSPRIGANNRAQSLEIEEEYYDEITPGANCNHAFRVEFSKNDIFNLTICYTQGTKTVLVKNYSDVQISGRKFGNKDICYIRYSISPEESRRFNTYNKDCNVQLKLLLLDGNVDCSPIFKIKINKTLFNNDEMTSNATITNEALITDDDTNRYLEVLK